MSGLLTIFKENYNHLYYKYSDPQTREWPLVSSPFPTMILVALYLFFIKVIGPRMMQNRKPFKLKKAMLVYNGLQTVLSGYLASMGWYYGWRNYSFTCQPLTDLPYDNEMRKLGWGFFMIRFLEFTDTIFFILRKKYSQVSTLHVVHHTLVPFIFWIGVLTFPAGHYSLAAFLNAVVHTFMYSYYLLAALGPKYQKWLFWKKYMTTMQLAQFFIVVIHASLTVMSDCDIPKWVAWFILAQGALFFIMFLDFYLKNFVKEKKRKSQVTQKTIQNGNKVNDEKETHTLLRQRYQEEKQE